MADEPELAEGSTGEWVTHLQEWLAHLNFYTGAVDGEFLDKTAAAVQAAQNHYGLDEHGTVGPQTWKVVELARSENRDVTVEWGEVDVTTVDVEEETAPSSEGGWA